MQTSCLKNYISNGKNEKGLTKKFEKTRKHYKTVYKKSKLEKNELQIKKKIIIKKKKKKRKAKISRKMNRKSIKKK